MLTIGDFARFAGVSVRMLRHYVAIGLLVPTSVDPHSGYRRYDESLLLRAHRLVALRELGFGLEQVGAMLDGSADDLQRLLEERRVELAGQIEADRARLVEVERRLRLTRGDTMELTFTETDLPELRVAQLTGEVADQSEVGPAIGPLFARIGQEAAERCLNPEPSLAWYGMTDDGIHFGACGPAALAGAQGLEEATLEARERAVVTTYTGPLVRIGDAWQTLGAHLAEQGLHADGDCREIYHRTPPDADPAQEWVIELQQPVR